MLAPIVYVLQTEMFSSDADNAEEYTYRRLL